MQLEICSTVRVNYKFKNRLKTIIFKKSKIDGYLSILFVAKLKIYKAKSHFSSLNQITEGIVAPLALLVTHIGTRISNGRISTKQL